MRTIPEVEQKIVMVWACWLVCMIYICISTAFLLQTSRVPSRGTFLQLIHLHKLIDLVTSMLAQNVRKTTLA